MLYRNSGSESGGQTTHSVLAVGGAPGCRTLHVRSRGALELSVLKRKMGLESRVVFCCRFHLGTLLCRMLSCFEGLQFRKHRHHGILGTRRSGSRQNFSAPRFRTLGACGQSSQRRFKLSLAGGCWRLGRKASARFLRKGCVAQPHNHQGRKRASVRARTTSATTMRACHTPSTDPAARARARLAEIHSPRQALSAAPQSLRSETPRRSHMRCR